MKSACPRGAGGREHDRGEDRRDCARSSQSVALALLLEEESEDSEEEDEDDEPFELESLDDLDSPDEDEELSLFLELSFSFISRERFFVP